MAFMVGNYKNVPIYAVGNYIPKKSGSQNDFSRQVIEFKNGKSTAITFFSREVYRLIGEAGIINHSLYLATVPSSTAGKAHAGFGEMIKLLSQHLNIKNTGNLIIRVQSKEPAHKGGSRSKALARNTSKVPLEIAKQISGQNVILLDDVTTTTQSLQVGIEQLQATGAKVIMAIAMGRTLSLQN